MKDLCVGLAGNATTIKIQYVNSQPIYRDILCRIIVEAAQTSTDLDLTELLFNNARQVSKHWNRAEKIYFTNMTDKDGLIFF
jgi:hypothetical protein